MSKKPNKASSSQSSLLTVKQVAEVDGTCERTVRRAIKSGRLRALKMGPNGWMVRITPEAHDAYRRAGRDDA